MDEYSVHIYWDAPGGEWVGVSSEFPLLRGWGATRCEALWDLEDAICAALAALGELGEDAPEAFHFRGVRI